MTIKELMSQVDVNRVADAFLLLDFGFSESNYENDFFEKYEAIPKMKNIINENIRLFTECKSDEDTVPYTVFIMYHQDDEDYENLGKKVFSCFATCDEDVLQILEKDFYIFDNEGETEVQRYSFDAVPMKDMVNYVIAESSIKELGKEICVAKILSEVFFWGVFPEDREKKVEELFEKLTKPKTEKELIDSKSFTEIIMKKHMEELLSNMSEDEKAYDMAKKRFEKETEEIRNRYWQKIDDKIQKQYIKAIKMEYKGRCKNSHTTEIDGDWGARCKIITIESEDKYELLY